MNLFMTCKSPLTEANGDRVMRNSRSLVVWSFAVFSILGCGDAPIVNPDIAPDENLPLPERIAFASDRDGDFEIYMINADGTSLIRLTESKGVDVRPLVGPLMAGNSRLFPTGAAAITYTLCQWTILNRRCN